MTQFARPSFRSPCRTAARLTPLSGITAASRFVLARLCAAQHGQHAAHVGTVGPVSGRCATSAIGPPQFEQAPQTARSPGSQSSPRSTSRKVSPKSRSIYGGGYLRADPYVPPDFPDTLPHHSSPDISGTLTAGTLTPASASSWTVSSCIFQVSALPLSCDESRQIIL